MLCCAGLVVLCSVVLCCAALYCVGRVALHLCRVVLRCVAVCSVEFMLQNGIRWFQMFKNSVLNNLFFCSRRWREVLTSSAPGHMEQMQALVLKYPEVAEVRKTLFCPIRAF